MTRWQRFGHWRRTRPFWAGLLIIGSGLVILAPPFAALRLGDLVVSLRTLGGGAALFIGVMLIVLGISVWIRPQFRVPAGVAAALLALVSLPTANLGGLIIGMLLGLVGAALAVSWSDRPRACVLLLVTLMAGTALAGIARPASAAPQVEGCPSPEPDRARAPSAGLPPVAVRPFRVDASRLDLHQVDLVNSNKIVSVPTRQGDKRALRLVAGTIEITDLRLTSAAGSVPRLSVITALAGSRSRLVGPVTIYLEKLCGTLAIGPLGVGFGVPGAVLPPISPSSPPPAVLPEITFTNVTFHAAALSSTQLHLPASHILPTP